MTQSRTYLAALGSSFLVVLVMASSSAANDAEKLAFFEAKIRPVLIKQCYQCHATDAEEVKGNLLLDSAPALLKGGDSGPALVAGKPDDSLLIAALRYDDMEMPPDGKLPDNVIADFEKWVAMGAPDPRTEATQVAGRRTIDIEEGRKFWAFQPPRSHDAPKTKDESWARSEIDLFILAKLEAAKLKPAPDADRTTLVRRLYFDLIGLPPTPEQLQAALADESPQWVETLVDRLLASRQFGVHWGRHWLDVARYADSNGSDFNATFHNAWRYRDYVVDAMNDDKPFDTFVREQLAGDLLPADNDEQRAEQLVASGFLMLGTKMLSERDKSKLQMDVVDEQIDTVGRGILGLTLGCARCHDHKFDPIPTRDYYALAGIFRSTRTLEGESQKYVSTWRKSELPASEQLAAALAKHNADVKQIKGKLDAAKKQLAAVESDLAKKQSGLNQVTVDDTQAEVAGSWKASTYTPLFVGKGYIHDDQTDKGEKSVQYIAKLPKSGTYEVRLSYTSAAGRATNVPVAIAHAEGETEVTLDQSKKPPIDKLYAAVGRFPFDAEKPASVTIFTTGTTGYVIADAVQFVELDDDGKPVSNAALDNDKAVQELKSKVEQQKTSITVLGEQLKKLEADAPPPLPKAIAASDFAKADDCQICIRGEHRNLGERVPRGFLQVAMTTAPPQIPADASGRRELADWIASADHPLTGRVMVNRVWMHLLGEGIVRSVDNFGQLGERPTHPELLDELATRFVSPASDSSDSFGWSIKNLVREIVLSRTYQMSSRHDEASWRKDPENRLQWHAKRRRLPAEAIRDAMLAISGQLDLSPGGTPVKGLGVLVNNSKDEGDYAIAETSRRSLYLPVIRSELPAMLTVFDFADPDLVVGKRPVTNVPAQALLLMNSPLVMDVAGKTAQRIVVNEKQSREETIAAMYRLVLSREPTDAERERSIAFLPTDSGDQAALQKKTALLVHVLLASTEFRMLE